MKIALGLCFYNKRDEIKRLLDSIPVNYKTFDLILAIDGIYPFIYDLKKNKARASEFINPLSDDGSREILNEFQKEKGIPVIMDNCVGNEYQKRMRYLELCRMLECNYLLIVDSDEYFTEPTDWLKFRDEFRDLAIAHCDHNVFNVRFIADLYGRMVEYPRAWFNPQEMTYVKNSHYKFKNFTKYEEMTDILDSQYASATLESLYLKHDHNLRKDQDMSERDEYEDYLVRYEELVQKDFSPECADKIARLKPANHKDGCICFKCIEYKKIDVNKLIDPRPHDKRIDDPFKQFRK